MTAAVVSATVSARNRLAQGEKVVYDQIDAPLVDVERNLKVWTGQQKIKKDIEKPRVRL